MRLYQLDRGEALELGRRRVGVEVSLERRGHNANQGPRAPLKQRPVRRDHERLGQGARRDFDLLPFLDLEAPLAQQRRKRVGVEHPG